MAFTIPIQSWALPTARENISSQTHQNNIHYPRNPEDIYEALKILQHLLPSELVLEILEHAQYWVLSRVSISKEVSYAERDCHNKPRYLVSNPIQGEQARVREIRFDISSHDQGWSSFSKDHGTFRNSWTWFDLGIEWALDRETIPQYKDIRMATNLHASSQTNRHRIVYRNDQDLPLLSLLRNGDSVSIIPRARFPGWTNYVESASIEIYTDHTGTSARR